MVDEVFKNLVDQFSDPFTCLRELVQNAMDAGTEQIEIRTHYLNDPGGVCLEIRDFGEGMNRDIIDGKLTRLFSSDKEDDLTKIGKFGIGFVSVFSLKPELVTVDTGRDGEFWRIAFDGSTDFQLFELHQPQDGTSVKLYKILPHSELDEFNKRCEQTVSKWCRHSGVDISFNGQLINRAMEVDSVCRVQVNDPLGLFDVGLTDESPSPIGFYNTGLTLTEGESDNYPGVTVKILSNHLEHTLTRDAVMMDENYHKVMTRLSQVISTELFESMCRQLLAGPELREQTAEVAARYLSYQYKNLSSDQKNKPFMLDLFGKPVSIKALEKSAKEEDRIFATQKLTSLAERADREGLPILPVELGSTSARFLSTVFEVPVVSLEHNLAISRPAERTPGLRAITSTMWSLLREGRILVSSIVPVEYPDSATDPNSPPCVFALGSDRLVRKFRKGFWATKYLLPQQLLLDVHHPLVKKALSRAENPASRKLAAYTLCKAALLNDGLATSTEQRLLKTLVEKS